MSAEIRTLDASGKVVRSEVKCLHKTGGGGISIDANGVTTHTQFCDQCGWKMETKTPPVASSPSSTKEIEHDRTYFPQNEVVSVERFKAKLDELCRNAASVQACQSLETICSYDWLLIAFRSAVSSWEALTKENEGLRKNLCESLEALTARCSVLEADAKRLDWLIEQKMYVAQITDHYSIVFPNRGGILTTSSGSTPRDAIDAAMGDGTNGRELRNAREEMADIRADVMDGE